MELFSMIMTYAQLPMALLLAWHCGKVRTKVKGIAPAWISSALLAIICCCAGMLAWRLSTLSFELSFEARVAGGTGFQTLFIISSYVLASAIGSMSDQRQ